MKLIFLACKLPESSAKRTLSELPMRLIMRYQWGVPYFHIACVDPRVTDKVMVWEAVTDGVVHREQDMDEPFDAYYVDVDSVRAQLYCRKMDEKIGLSYDFLGLYGFLWRSDKYQDNNKWFCSELGANGLMEAKVPAFNWNIMKPHRVTPALLVAGLKGPYTLGELRPQAEM